MHDFIMSIFEFLTEIGYIGIAIALMIEVIPSEIVLSYAGYLVSIGEVSFLGAVVAGTIGGTIAQLFLFWLGAYGGRPFIEKYGKYILINQKHIDISEQWFKKYGPFVIFAARFIPVVRHAISIPAGISKMSHKKFTLYTLAAIIPWSIFFIFLGDKLGDNWRKINEVASPYTKYFIVIAILILIIYFLYKSKKWKRSRIK